MEFERNKSNHTHINIAPLVDVVFLLLLFFMLTSNLIKENSIKVRLPQSKTAEVLSKEVNTIYITKDGDVYFMDRRVDLENLKEVLENSVKDKSLINIKADRETDVGVVINVIDEIRLLGIKNYTIVTERR